MTLRLAVLVTSCLWSGVVMAQTAAPELTRQQRDLLSALVTAVERAPAAASGDDDHAWLLHVLRASDGSHYVAFSITPRAHAMPDGPLIIYVRLATAATPGVMTTTERSVVREWLAGSRTDPRLLPRRGIAIGEMPPMGAGAIGARGAASVGSADLQVMGLERERARQRREDEERRRRAELEGTSANKSDRLPFEDFEVGLPASFRDGTSAIQRALTAGPGTYDLSVAWTEASQPAAKAQVHVARRILQLAPAAAEFGLSSVVVADRIGVREIPYSSLEQRAHPYTIGATEILPSRDTVFTPNERLSVAFQIVNPAPSPGGKPDVVVNMRIVRVAGARDELVASLTPLTYNAATLPADFDVRAGHPLIAAMSAPLATVRRGEYRLLITAEDRVAGAVISTNAPFTVVGTAASLLAEAPALAPRFNPADVLQAPIVTILLDHLAPANPTPALAKSLQSARSGRFADLLVEEPVAPAEQGVRTALTGLALLSLGNLGAIAQFERALGLQAASGPVRFLLGAARALQNRDPDAISAWRSARDTGPLAPIVNRLLAEAYLRQKDYQNAADALTAAGVTAEDAELTRTFAATRIALGRGAEAVAALDRLLARDPGHLEARWLLLHALYSDLVKGNQEHRDRFLAEAQRYIDAKGPHAGLAAEWSAVTRQRPTSP